MTVRLKLGVRRPPAPTDTHTPHGVVEQVCSVLTAAADLAVTYDLAYGALSEWAFYERVIEAGHEEVLGSRWPCDAELADVGEVVIRDGSTGVYRLKDGSLALLTIAGGWLYTKVAAAKRESAQAIVENFALTFPPLYGQQDEGTVPITFWTFGQYGPQSRLRLIDAATWAEIEGNYTAPVRDELAHLMDGFEPGKTGQLLLWQGPPGTGKTWALRALASEWRDWAEFSYITDPDAFFVTSPEYMIDVLLHESYEELTVIDGEVETVSTARLDKWRVLILEDTGELLAANAKESYGQGLSRLLNVVDGLVGQGLRVLVLVTTNDELGDLHPAVKRPGRCASQIEFAPLTAEEATAWYGQEITEPTTVAELFARGAMGEEALEASSDERRREFLHDADATYEQISETSLEDLIRLASQPLPEVTDEEISNPFGVE